MKLPQALRKFRGHKPGFEFDVRTLDQYVSGGDHMSNAVDIVPGWNSRLPIPERELGGKGVLYDDARMRWAVEMAGGVAGCSVLEIGPLEASHTYMLAREKAQVTAVEANKLAFLKCLVVKELCGFDARFHLAEVNEWLDATDERFDLVVACGVLYHMREPVEFLERVGRKANKLYLWTHYVEEDLMAQAIPRPQSGAGPASIPHFYSTATEDPSFCGGVFPSSRWMTLDGILQTLRGLSFDSIETAHQLSGTGASSISIFARRSQGAF